MHIHILGICGTFMGSLAVLAKQQGHRVTGCDQHVYPPMSTQLEQQGIDLIEGFKLDQLDLEPDLFVIGNAISRGNPLLEEILNKGLPYTSGPQMLAETVLPGKWVLAVAGTHGKTTTTSMLAWILDYAGYAPGFLIGGVPNDFDCSARLGETPFFVIEADEYDSAFFDKRSKFVHYRPKTFIFNNLEYDHADIFADLEAIQTQFHHVIRTIPKIGRLIHPAGVPDIDAVIEKGCWSEIEGFSKITVSDNANAPDEPTFKELKSDGSEFQLSVGEEVANVNWGMTGAHNVNNGVAAMLAARHVGVQLPLAGEALSKFGGVKRRMECLASIGRTKVYDDFAHHPTAIESTLKGLREKVGNARIIALIEPRSNTMRMGVHEQSLLPSAETADSVVWANLGGLDWLGPMTENASDKHQLGASVEELIESCIGLLPTDNDDVETHIVCMSNGGFGGIHNRLIEAIQARA